MRAQARSQPRLPAPSAYKSPPHHLFYAQLEQGIGEAADVAVQLFILICLLWLASSPSQMMAVRSPFLADGGQGSLPPDSACRPRTFNGHITGGKGGIFHLLVRFIQSRIFPCSPQKVSGTLIDCDTSPRTAEGLSGNGLRCWQDGVFVNLAHAFVLLVGC